MYLKKTLAHVCFLVIFPFISYTQKIIRGPYLQQPTTNSIVVRWRTDVPTETKINFGTDINSKANSTSNVVKTVEHILKIENLQADTKYYYEIVPSVGTTALNLNQFFVTVPKKESKKAMHFWAGGDFGDLSNFVYLSNQTQVRDAHLSYSKKFETNLWLWLGDVGYGGNRDFQLQTSIFDFYGEKILPKIPFAAALGNHEFDEDPINQQKTRDVNLLKVTSPPTNGEAGGIASKNKAYYSFDYGNTHFICLDSYGMDDGKFRIYDIDSPQYQWLVKDLDAQTSMWTVVFFHHPPYTKRAHDSDTEQELRLIRQTLVPVFDKYKVDLVLNGHSHLYERSYLMQNHLGHSDSFDTKNHIVDKSSGKYFKNEPPFINKSNGTIYVVSGTFGRLEPVLANRLNQAAHPSSYFSDLLTGGSLEIKIEDNRLDCEWLCADGVVRDRFTMLKNVNKTTKINIEYGEKVKPKASWPGTYRWSNGVNNQSEIEINSLKSGVYSVKDSLGFLEDKFEVTVAPQPFIETLLTNTTIFCAGKTITGNISLKHTQFEKWKYYLELSDEKGLFENSVLKQEITTKDFNFIIPKNIKESKLYKVRVTPNSNLFDVKSTENIAISLPAEGRFINDSIIPFKEELLLKLNFTGSFPISYTLNFQSATIINQSTAEIKVKQFEAKNYILESVNNVCGIGSVTNNKVLMMAPLATEIEESEIKIYPNPANSQLIIELNKKPTLYTIITNIEGKQLLNQDLNIGKNIINLTVIPKGIYYIQIDFGNKKVQNKFIKQ